MIMRKRKKSKMMTSTKMMEGTTIITRLMKKEMIRRRSPILARSRRISQGRRRQSRPLMIRGVNQWPIIFVIDMTRYVHVRLRRHVFDVRSLVISSMMIRMRRK